MTIKMISNGFSEIEEKEFIKGIEEDRAVAIDVRTYEEFCLGHISGAINKDVLSGRFSADIQELNKNDAYYVYCNSGIRSRTACKFMNSFKFYKLLKLKGGLNEYTGELITEDKE